MKYSSKVDLGQLYRIKFTQLKCLFCGFQLQRQL